MKFIQSCLALSLSIIYISAAESTSERLPRKNVLLYREAGEVKTAMSPEQWKRRHSEILEAMQSVMGKLPGHEKRVSVEVKIEEEVDCGSYVRRLITYATEPGVRTPAYLCIPKVALAGKKKVPAVLCLHPTDNKVGHKVVLGLGGREGRQYAKELAERGFVTFSPSYPMLANYWPKVLELGHESGTMKAIWDNIRGLDYLESLPFVDSSKGFGTIGHSLGGHNSVYTAVFDERIKVVVSSCGLDAYIDYYDGNEKRWFPGQGWCQVRYMPKLADFRGRLNDIPYDFHEMIAALAPRVCFICAPLGDGNFRWKSVDRVAKAASAVYGLHGKKKNLIVEHPDCGHNFPVEMREKAYGLFEKHLGKP
ncbi:MAG: alpha/beta hydrolase [Verrucomicrobiales bacterium]|nr:alpha/beta hydrolase [Verrucomicrobiales bacterium]